jgi:hypothetical protein
MTFKERAKRGLELLSKQPPITLEMAKKQVEFLKAQSMTKNKKLKE